MTAINIDTSELFGLSIRKPHGKKRLRNRESKDSKGNQSVSEDVNSIGGGVGKNVLTLIPESIDSST